MLKLNRQCQFQNLNSTVAIPPTVYIGTRQKIKGKHQCAAWVRPASNDPISVLIRSGQMRFSLGTFQWRALPCHTCMVLKLRPMSTSYSALIILSLTHVLWICSALQHLPSFCIKIVKLLEASRTQEGAFSAGRYIPSTWNKYIFL